MSYCGGEPIEDLEYVRNFLSTSGIPILNHYPVWQLIRKARIATVAAMDLQTDNSTFAFNRGAYFYAGLLREVGGVHILPTEDSVVNEFADRMDSGPFDLGVNIYGKAQGIPSFGKVFERVRPVLIGDDLRDYQTVLLGAGTVHYLFMESAARLQDPDNFTQNHPELEGIFDNFTDPPPVD